MSESTDAGGQEPLGDPPPASESRSSSSRPTDYLVLWAKRPDPETIDDGDPAGAGLKFRIHSSGVHTAHNRESVKRAVWTDEKSPEAGEIRQAAEKYGVEIRPVPIRNFGPAASDEDLVRVVTDVREVWGGDE